jgi:radical SAM superfamily enzyme YgiQ (UPF0313 family)
MLPEEAAAHADAVVVGEAEAVWEQLLSDLEEGCLARVYRSSEAPRPYQLSQSRVPRYDLLDVERYNRLTLQTTRGCPLDCSFCAASRLISKYKKKPIENVRRELEAIVQLWPGAFIELADDNTFFDKRWGRELAQLFTSYNVRWFTETDISVAEDEALLELLANSGCAQLLIGLESVRPESLAQADSRLWKYDQYESVIRKIERIQSYGISVNGCFVLGFDHDDPSVFEETLKFVEASPLAEVQVTILTPFPGTKLYRDLEQEDRLVEKVFWDKCTLFDATFHPQRMSIDELTSGFRWLMQRLYNQEQTRRRKKQFEECVRVGFEKKRSIEV